MSNPSSSQSDLTLRWFMACFPIAAVGGFVDYLGWYLFNSRVLAMIGFFVGAGGVALGAVSVVLFQIIGVVKAIGRRRRDGE